MPDEPTLSLSLGASVIFISFYLNSYPFQPSATLSQWVSILSIIALLSCVRVFFGMNRDGVMTRVRRNLGGSAIINFDAVAKGFGYLLPLVAFAAAISMNFSDIFRILVFPIFR